MSAKELSEEKLKNYKDILKKEKNETQSIINKICDKMKGGSRENSGDLSSYSIHQADLGTDTSNSEREAYLLEEQLKKLKKINQALHRIYDKTYGICEISGRYISENRLKAVPWARYCIKIKEQEERKSRRRA
ncbi:MAG: TraR/DksA C4-type zinc finger protein [Candidatus Cloacimonetes bacterium]|nr:TraR/DksA C4-type zinc finger protein [Candidatus Cloacimonadota bacterium]